MARKADLAQGNKGPAKPDPKLEALAQKAQNTDSTAPKAEAKPAPAASSARAERSQPREGSRGSAGLEKYQSNNRSLAKKLAKEKAEGRVVPTEEPEAEAQAPEAQAPAPAAEAAPAASAAPAAQPPAFDIEAVLKAAEAPKAQPSVDEIVAAVIARMPQAVSAPVAQAAQQSQDFIDTKALIEASAKGDQAGVIKVINDGIAKAHRAATEAAEAKLGQTESQRQAQARVAQVENAFLARHKDLEEYTKPESQWVIQAATQRLIGKYGDKLGTLSPEQMADAIAQETRKGLAPLLQKAAPKKIPQAPVTTRGGSPGLRGASDHSAMGNEEDDRGPGRSGLGAYQQAQARRGSRFARQ